MIYIIQFKRKDVKMKKTIYIFIIFVIIFATISFADLNEKAVVNATAVRIRESESTRK